MFSFLLTQTTLNKREKTNCMKVVKMLFLFWFGFVIFRAAPMACGGSQPRGRIGAIAAGLHHSHTRSLTHWARPGIKPATSWFPVGFVNHCATTGTPSYSEIKKKTEVIMHALTSRWLHTWKVMAADHAVLKRPVTRATTPFPPPTFTKAGESSLVA